MPSKLKKIVREVVKGATTSRKVVKNIRRKEQKERINKKFPKKK